MSDESFQLPKSAYDEVRNIIVAYAHLNNAGSLQDVSDLSGTNTTTISRNNGFLVSAGIIEGGQKKSSTPLGKQLANALQHDIPSEVARYWKEVVNENDFLQKILAAVRIRNGMDRSAFESHIAYTAGEKKTSRVMTGANTIVDILSIADLIKESDGKIVVVARDRHDEEFEKEAPKKQAGPSSSFAEEPETVPTDAITHVRTVEGPTGVTIAITLDVNISCDVNELEALGKGLRSLLQQLNEDFGEHGETSE